MERGHENQPVAWRLEAGDQVRGRSLTRLLASRQSVEAGFRLTLGVALSAHPSAMRPSSSHQLAGLILW